MNTFRSPRSRAGFLGGVAAVLLVASGCSSEGSDTAATGGDSEDQPASDAIVATQDIDDVGTVLVDVNGNALYTTEAENDGSVKCVDGCADFWPPLTAESGETPSVEGIDAEFGSVTRPDGTEQVTLDGNPLYTFAEDQEPGDVNGDGFEDDFQGTHFIWHVVTVDGAAPPDDGTDDDGGSGYGY